MAKASRKRPEERELYSNVVRRIWNDAKFRELSPIPPCGQGLMFRLLVAPECKTVPGLYQAWEAGLAQALKWPLDAFRDAFAEAYGKGMVKADWEAGLVWLPNGVKHNPPQSINVVKGWAKQWREFPECRLRDEALRHLQAYCEGMSDAFGDAFRDAFADELRKASAKPCPIQEQEQEQEQEIPPNPPRGTGDDEPDPEPSKPKRLPKDLLAGSFDPPEYRADVIRVWDAWRNEFGKPNAKLSHRPAQSIAERLAEGMTEEDVQAVFRGARLDDWLEKQGYRVSLLFGDRERYDHLLDVGGEPKDDPADDTQARAARERYLAELPDHEREFADPNYQPETTTRDVRGATEGIG